MCYEVEGSLGQGSKLMDLAPGKLAVVSRLFSSGVVREMARTGSSPLFARLASQARSFHSFPKTRCVADFLDAAFALLQREGCRDEYVYKAALTHRILLGTHSLQTASMLNEFRVGECKADLAILNGTATVYEVKSERDTLSRLQSQICAYRKVFAKAFVIVGENHVDSVLGCVPADVGVMRLDRRLYVSTVREAADRPERTLPAAIFASVRTVEACMILESCGRSIPVLPNTQLNHALRELFLGLEPREAHEGMVRVLKKTRNLMRLSELVEQLPHSLQPAALVVPLRKMDHARLVSAVNTSLGKALAWA